MNCTQTERYLYLRLLLLYSLCVGADYNTGCCAAHHREKFHPNSSSNIIEAENARACVCLWIWRESERATTIWFARAVVIYFTGQKLVKVFLRPFKRASCEREEGFFTSIKQRTHHRQTTDSS